MHCRACVHMPCLALTCCHAILLESTAKTAIVSDDSAFDGRFADAGRRKRDGNAAMTQPAKAQEPSMEEILASIRRIIADDDATKPAAAAAAARPPPRRVQRRHRRRRRRDSAAAAPGGRDAAASGAAGARNRADPERHRRRARRAGPGDPADGAAIAGLNRDMLELTEAMQTPAASFRTIDGQPDVMFAEANRSPRRRLSRCGGAAIDCRLRRALEQPHDAIADAREPARCMSQPTSAAVDSAFNALAHTVLVQNARTLDDLVQGDAAADAEVLARRQSAEAGRAAGARRDRARLARALIRSRQRSRFGLTPLRAEAEREQIAQAAETQAPTIRKTGTAREAVDHRRRSGDARSDARYRAPTRRSRPRCRAPAAPSAWRWSAACCAPCRSRARSATIAGGASHQTGASASVKKPMPTAVAPPAITSPIWPSRFDQHARPSTV